MSYRRGVLLAILLHSIILLCLTKVYWPMQEPAGWHNAVIVQSYLYAPKNSSKQTHTNHTAAIGKSEKRISRQTHKIKKLMFPCHSRECGNPEFQITKQTSPFNEAQKNASESANLSQGQYNQLLVLLHNAIASKQIYPANAAMLGQHGNVALSFILQSSGVISTITVKKSSGFSLLDNAAIAAVQAISPFSQMQVAHNINLTIQIQFSG